MIFEDPRLGIMSLADARRRANISRNRATDQYESDVADFQDNIVTDLENDFMNNTFVGEPILDPPFIDPPFIGEPVLPPPPVDRLPPPDDNIYDPIINPPRPPITRPPIDDPLPPIFVPPIDPPFEDPIDPPYQPPYEPPVNDPIPTPPFEPPFDPPISMPPPEPPFDPPYLPPSDPPPFDGGIVEPPPIIIGPPGLPGDPPMDPPFDPPMDPPDPPDNGIDPPDNGIDPPPPDNGGDPVQRGYYIPRRVYDSGVPAIIRNRYLDKFGEAPFGFIDGILDPPRPPEPPIRKPPIIKPPPPGNGGTPPKPPIMCFVAGTKIDMADGSKKLIENMKVGDKVETLNGIDEISYVHDIPKDDRELWTINNKITATDAHAFLTEQGWKSNNPKLSNTVYHDYGIYVEKLQLGDKLITKNGTEEITKLSNQKDFVKVYNFTTSKTHTYLVDGVVSHNKLPPITVDDARFRNEYNLGGAIGRGIMRLPQSQQGDTMTTQIFQRLFRPRR